MTPDMTQQAIAAAAAQARVPTPTVSPKGKAAPSPGATGAKGVPQGPSPQKGQLSRQKTLMRLAN